MTYTSVVSFHSLKKLEKDKKRFYQCLVRTAYFFKGDLIDSDISLDKINITKCYINQVLRHIDKFYSAVSSFSVTIYSRPHSWFLRSVYRLDQENIFEEVSRADKTFRIFVFKT